MASENMFGQPTPMTIAILLGVPILAMIVLAAVVGRVIYVVVRLVKGLAERHQPKESDSGNSH